MKTIGFINQKGGVGKTTLAIHFAAWLRMQYPDARILLLDVDPQGNSQHWSNQRAGAPLFAVVGKPSETIHRQFSEISIGYDYVIIDGPANVSKINGSAILCCNTIIVPVQPSSLDIWASAATLDVIDGLQGDSKRRSAFLLTRMDERTLIGKAASEALQSMPIPALQHTIAQRTIYPGAMSDGRTIYEAQPGGIADKESRAVFAEILEFSN